MEGVTVRSIQSETEASINIGIAAGSHKLLKAIAAYHYKRVQCASTREAWRQLAGIKLRGQRGPDRKRRMAAVAGPRSIQILERAVAWEETTIADFNHRSNNRKFSKQRQAVALAIQEASPGLSYAAIARLLGRNDHTTIVYAVQQAAKRCEYDKEYAAYVEAIRG